jgi:hypothetical protein
LDVDVRKCIEGLGGCGRGGCLGNLPADIDVRPKVSKRSQGGRGRLANLPVDVDVRPEDADVELEDAQDLAIDDS